MRPPWQATSVFPVAVADAVPLTVADWLAMLSDGVNIRGAGGIHVHGLSSTIQPSLL